MSTAENVTKTTGIAMDAVARHWLDNDLPAPVSIQAPPLCTADAVSLFVASTSMQAWVESIHVDDVETGDAPPLAHQDYERVCVTGRLPVGVRVRIVANQRRVAPLRLVGAGS